jgi:hypothetical protein
VAVQSFTSSGEMGGVEGGQVDCSMPLLELRVCDRIGGFRFRHVSPHANLLVWRAWETQQILLHPIFRVANVTNLLDVCACILFRKFRLTEQTLGLLVFLFFLVNSIRRRASNHMLPVDLAEAERYDVMTECFSHYFSLCK